MSTVENSVREDESSLFYTHRRGNQAVTFTVLRVSGDYIGCDLTTHAADYAGEEMCATLGMNGVCLGTSLAFARGFYRALQVHGNTEHVPDERVFGALIAYLADEFGT